MEVTIFESKKKPESRGSMQSFKLEELRMPNYMKPLMPQRIAMGWDLRPHKKSKVPRTLEKLKHLENPTDIRTINAKVFNFD